MNNDNNLILKWFVKLKNTNNENDDIIKIETLARTKDEAISLGNDLVENESYGLLGWKVIDAVLTLN